MNFNFSRATSKVLYIETTVPSEHDSSMSNTSFSLWHHRLGHPHTKLVASILNSCNISLPINKQNCHACSLGKIHKLRFSTSATFYTNPLQLIEVDLWVPV